MIRSVFVLAGLGLGLCAGMAQSNPIAERQQAMKAISAAAREGAAIAKGEAPFEAPKAQAVFKVFADAGKKLPALFPENSREGGQTRAAPAIWDDAAGFKAALAKFEADAAAGTAVTDLAGFRAAFGAATRDCGACHESYRIKR